MPMQGGNVACLEGGLITFAILDHVMHTFDMILQNPRSRCHEAAIIAFEAVLMVHVSRLVH